MTIDWAELVRVARATRSHAHAPYSDYRVGAALLTRSGKVFGGCNVENASFGLTICAERVAIGNMVAAGEGDPVALVVITPGPQVGMPCGMCRQTLAEFASDLPIQVALPEGETPPIETTLGELLPRAFRWRQPALEETERGEVLADVKK
ncbi:cytidine deaminase [Desulfobulbus sp. AH-315-M07]|nr:cytidine deaminase [Desulfobulbus sp. AH-315-M07]